MSTHAQGGSKQVGAQVGSFSDTKNKVVKVPAEPPKGGGLAALANPVEMVKAVPAALLVAIYQEGTQVNQAAYQGYSGATTPQASGFPQPAEVKAGSGPDTHIEQGKVDPDGGRGSGYAFSGVGGGATKRSSASGGGGSGSDYGGFQGGGTGSAGAVAHQRGGGGSAPLPQPGSSRGQGDPGYIPGHTPGQSTSTAGYAPPGGGGRSSVTCRTRGWVAALRRPATERDRAC